MQVSIFTFWCNLHVCQGISWHPLQVFLEHDFRWGGGGEIKISGNSRDTDILIKIK